MCNFVQAYVIRGNHSVSMKVSTKIYGFDKDDNGLRKVEQRLEKEFRDKILFLSACYHEVQMVVSRATLMKTNFSYFIKDSN